MKRFLLVVAMLLVFSGSAFATGEFCVNAGTGANYRIGYDTMSGSILYSVIGERYGTFSSPIPLVGSARVLTNGTITLSFTLILPYSDGWISPAASITMRFPNASLAGGTYQAHYHGGAGATSTFTGSVTAVACPASRPEAEAVIFMGHVEGMK
jgi:hypothetical protein